MDHTTRVQSDVAAVAPHNACTVYNATRAGHALAANGTTAVAMGPLTPGLYSVFYIGGDSSLAVYYRTHSSSTPSTLTTPDNAGQADVNVFRADLPEVIVQVPAGETYLHFRLSGAGTNLLHAHPIV